MDKKGKTDWDEFIRITLGVLFIGGGVAMIIRSAGQLGGMIVGFLLIGIGLAAIMSKR